MKNIKDLIADHYWLIVLFSFKIVLYYTLIDLSPINGFVGGITLIYLMFIFYCCFTSNAKYSGSIFTLIYIVITMLMFANTVYFSYFNQLTSINQIWQINSLFVVDESVKFAMPPISIILFLDIPIVIKYFKKSKLKNNSTPMKYLNVKNTGLITVFTLLIVVFAINPLKADAIKKVNHTEFFTYHVKDLIMNTYDRVVTEEKPMEDIVAVISENVKSIKKDNYYGIGKNRNLIIIQLESIQNFVINREYNEQIITPTINELLNNDTIYFDHFFQNIGRGNTSDAEFTINNSIYPVIQGEAYRLYEDNYFEGLPWLLKREGYSTFAFHGFRGNFWNRDRAYPYQGIDTFISQDELEMTDKISLGLSDKELFRQTAEYLQNIDNPFYSLIVALSSHHPFVLPEGLATLELKEEDIGTIFGNYLQSVRYVDEAIEEFINDLKEKDLYDDSIIVIYGDHHGLNCKDVQINKQMSEFLGYDYNYDEMLRVPLIIHIPGMDKTKTISTVGGQVDLFPTVANIMGLEIKHPFIFGRDLVNAKEGFVASITYMLEGSFIKDNVIFEMSRDGIFENSIARDLDTKEIVSLEGLEKYSKRAITLVTESKYVLDNNIIEIYNQQYASNE
ncbi:phosphoglycerol transferase MdoB-like AlkP superfamily enzyme [Natranaerovirga pectinivora]|uniref:Phosphoglycerol transferase MdoB-like AlkP superfamily enzyme n=1 Tax=Natranaerovirga pectinivora TaxID=682400 RepID=A0A4R3MLW1_9FIRM|nr:LTA synthase family protein [Natranaerovirga pectinivora]TCT14687.1 phosphoglycerol transferase MdoB-like AlkP superfamily enzyme [Natranaerovirga pectinivora]